MTRVIKKYSNRKLYDISTREYVTLPKVVDMIKQGMSISVIENDTKRDITNVVLRSAFATSLGISNEQLINLIKQY